MAYITARLSGGLGNQMFQIATAYTLAVDLGVAFRITYTSPGESGQGRPPERYIDSIYSNLRFLDHPLYSDCAVVCEPMWTYRSIKDLAINAIAQHGYACIRGYFQSDLYFRHRVAEIRSLFTPAGGYGKWLKHSRPSAAHAYRELLEDHSYCFIGVRRGDYMTPYNRTFHNPCGETYYLRAMQRLPCERYYVSSDDIEWCKRTFCGPQFHFIEDLDDIAKFALMTLFRRYIISNSTFYWWGSYLSQYEDRSVIAPDKWISGSDAEFHKYYSIYRDDMTVVNRPVEY